MNRMLRSAAEIIAGGAIAFVLTSAVAAVTARPAFLNNGWDHPAVRPSVIYTGNGSAPWISHLTWTSWSSGTARGTGVLTREKPHCTAAHPMNCPVQRLKVTVTLSQPKAHANQSYYSRMTWAFVNPSGHHLTQVWKYATLPGGSVPAWNQANYRVPATAAPAASA